MPVSIASAVVVGSLGRPARVQGSALTGPCGIRVEGLAGEKAADLARRVGAALSSCGLGPPREDIHLRIAGAPWADGLELAAAVAALVAVGRVRPAAVARFGFLGRLGLDGSVRPVSGAFPATEAVEAENVVVARANGAESALAEHRQVVPVDGLGQLYGMLTGAAPWPPAANPARHPAPVASPRASSPPGPNPSHAAALTVAAAGRHHVLVRGPGARARNMARRMAALLSPSTPGTALELARVRSAAGLRPTAVTSRAPWREVDPSASVLDLAGGSGALRPGEASLAHGGVLLLTDVDLFDRAVLSVLGEALRSGTVTVARGGLTTTLPADVQLVATTETASPGASGLPRWLEDRLSVRIDAGLDARSVGIGLDPTAATVADVRRVAQGRGWPDNEALTGEALTRVAPLAPGAAAMLDAAARAGSLSTSAERSVWRVARTVADFSGRGIICAQDMEAAIGLRWV